MDSDTQKQCGTFSSAPENAPDSPCARGCARAVSCLYMWYDNQLWAESVGLVKFSSSQKTTVGEDSHLLSIRNCRLLSSYQTGIIHLLQIKRKKNISSLIRLIITLIAEVFYFFSLSLSIQLKQLRAGKRIPDAWIRRDMQEHFLITVCW